MTQNHLQNILKPKTNNTRKKNYVTFAEPLLSSTSYEYFVWQPGQIIRLKLNQQHCYTKLDLATEL